MQKKGTLRFNHNSLKRRDQNKESLFEGFLNILIMFKIFYYAHTFKNNTHPHSHTHTHTHTYIYIYIYMHTQIVLIIIVIILS